MKKRLVIWLIALSACAAYGQTSVAEAWLSMPDSLCPFLSQQHRLQLLQYAKAGLTDTIQNRFEGRSYIDSIDLSGNYLSLQLTPNLHFSLQTADSLITIEQVICAPICNATTCIYSADWRLIRKEKQPWQIEQNAEDSLQYF